MKKMSQPLFFIILFLSLSSIAFSDVTSSITQLVGRNAEGCTGSNSWETGVPTDISLSFPGDNTFRSLIGVRMRIILVDAYVDYNMGNSNNSINAGVGFTIR